MIMMNFDYLSQKFNRVFAKLVLVLVGPLLDDCTETSHAAFF